VLGGDAQDLLACRETASWLENLVGDARRCELLANRVDVLRGGEDGVYRGGATGLGRGCLVQANSQVTWVGSR
jgi:hypothetical protein